MAANPRAAAVAALVRQEQDGFSNLVLDAELRRQKLEGRDKAFAGAIFYTVLEHQGTLDFILEQFLPKGLARLDPQVREILRAALAQARYMQVPVSAAVNEAVKLTRTFKKASASGLVNAVLRKACNYDLETARFRNETQRLMVLGSAGQDVAEFLRTHYPEEALGILTHTADGGCTSLRANCLKMDAAALCEKLLESGVKSAQPGLVPGSVLAKFEGSPAEHPLFKEGCFHVEGQASQLAALCVEAKPGDTVLDLCAAPGGKSFAAAMQMENTGSILSCDLHAHKISLIEKNAARLGISILKAEQRSASEFDPALEAQFDLVIADVPCSGLGVIRKKPDIRYKPLDAIERLPEVQRAILETVSRYVKPGGALLYSTCTVRKEENEAVALPFLQAHPEFSLEPFPVPDGLDLPNEGYAALLPHKHAADGFFICKLRKHA